MTGAVERREQMVDVQIARRGVRDEHVLAAIALVVLSLAGLVERLLPPRRPLKQDSEHFQMPNR